MRLILLTYVSIVLLFALQVSATHQHSHLLAKKQHIRNVKHHFGRAERKWSCPSRKQNKSSANAQLAAVATDSNSAPTVQVKVAPQAQAQPQYSGCFPSQGFNTPANLPASTDGWFCNQDNEYGFLGFAYVIDGCPSRDKMVADFKRMKADYSARYIRVYGMCQNGGFWDSMVDAAYTSGIGIYDMVWLGYGEMGSDQRWGALASRVSQIKSNPKAKFVIRALSLGNEAIPSFGLGVDMIESAKQQLAGTGISVSSSEYGSSWTSAHLNAVDTVMMNVLPAFDPTGGAAPRDAYSGLVGYAYSVGSKVNKKIIYVEAPYPGCGYAPNGLQGSTWNMQQWLGAFDDNVCNFKNQPHGTAYFMHMYSDEGSYMSNGVGCYGLLNADGSAKFNYKPRTSC